MEADAPPPQGPGSALSRLEPWLPWFLAGLALLLRTVAAARAELVHNDSILYMDMARLFFEGDWDGALAVVYHPAPSAIMALFRAVIPDMAGAGYAASALLSSLAVFPLYRLGKDLFGAAAGAWTALTYAVLPSFVLFGSSVLSEGPYFLFFATALWAFHESLRRRWWPAPVGGAAAGLAYLCRPEGGGLLVVFLGYAAYRAVAGLRKGESQAGRPVLAAGLAGAAFALVALPYLVHLRQESGRWIVTKKKSVGELVGVDEVKDRDDRARERFSRGGAAPAGRLPPAAPAPALGPGGPPRYELPEDNRGGAAVLRMVASLWEALHVVLQVLFYIPGLVGAAALLLWRRLPRGRGSPGLPLAVLAFYLGLCALFHFSYHYLSDRHLCGPALAFLPFVGAGLHLLAERGARSWRRLRPAEGKVSPVAVTGAVLALALVGASLPKGLSSFGRRKAYLRQVGEALAAAEGRGLAIMSTEMRLPHYAGGRYLPMPNQDGVEALRRAMTAGAAKLVVFNYSSDPFLRDYPELSAAFWAAVPPGFERVGVFDVKENGRPLVVLRRAGKGAP